MGEPKNPADDFGATTFDRPTFDFEAEGGANAAVDSASAASPGVQAPPRDVRAGAPAWAGTLPALGDHPAPVGPPVAQPAAPPPAVVVPAESAPEDPSDFKATVAHDRMHPYAGGAPIDDLKREAHLRKVANLAPVQGSPPPGSDRLLQFGLFLVVGLIAALLLGLVVGVIVELAAEPIEAAEVDE